MKNKNHIKYELHGATVYIVTFVFIVCAITLVFAGWEAITKIMHVIQGLNHGK